MSAIAQLGVQAGRSAVLGDSPLVKFASDAGVPLAVIHEMALLGGVDHATVIKAAYDHPDEFFDMASEIEKVGTQLSQQMTSNWNQGEGSPGRQAVSEMAGGEKMKGRLKNDPVQSRQVTRPGSMNAKKQRVSTGAGHAGTTRMGEKNTAKELAQAVSRATPAPGAGGPAVPHGNASPGARRMFGRTLDEFGEAGGRLAGSPFLERLRAARKAVLGRGMGKIPGINRLSMGGRGRLLAGGATALGLGGLGLGMLGGGGGGGGGGGAATTAATAAAPVAAASPSVASLAPGAGGDGASLTAGGGGGILNWIKSNPGKAALLGIGIPAGAYGLTRLMHRGDDEKEGGDYLGNIPRNRKELEKLAHDVMHHNAVVILNRHLDKMAADVSPRQVKSLRTIQSAVLGGSTLYDAVGKAFPKMASHHRVKVAAELSRNAMKSFLKEAGCGANKCEGGNKCSSKGGNRGGSALKGQASTRKEFHGKPDQAMGWMKGNS